MPTRVALGGLLCLAAACVPRVSVGCDLDTPYDVAVQRWTAHAELTDPITQRAAFAATVESRIFREQRVREQARTLGWGADRLSAELAKETQSGEVDTTFVVGAYTDRPRDNNLGDVTSIWSVVLETPAGQVRPTKIDQLGRTDENTRQLYPYLDLFRRMYRIHFAKVTDGPVTLRIASGIGIADLKFERL